MINDPKLRVGIVGCGNIAGPYARDLVTYPQIEVVGMADLDVGRAEKLAADVGGRAYATLEAMLADESIELVINLTIHQAHYATSKQCLEAGKHVLSEKPLAMTYEEARSLVEVAKAKGLRLGGAPFTFMGEAQQTAWKWIRDGRLGEVHVIYAEVNWGRIESWHPAPAPFYQAGALFDVGVYPLAVLTAIFGPVRRVWASGRVLFPDRVTVDGTPFHIETPDFIVALLELASGPLIRLTTNFYVTQQSKQVGIEFHGVAGSLYLSSWAGFNASVEFAEFGQPFTPVPLVKEPPDGVRWGRAAVDLAEALAEGRPHRASGEQAAHIVEILCAVTEAVKSNAAVPVLSDFAPPAPMEWAL